MAGKFKKLFKERITKLRTTAKLKKLFKETITKLEGVEDWKKISEILEEFEEKLPEGAIKKWFNNLGQKDAMAKVEKMMEEVDELDETALSETLEKFEKILKEVTKIIKGISKQLETPPRNVPEEIIEAYRKSNDDALSAIMVIFGLFGLVTKLFEAFGGTEDIS